MALLMFRTFGVIIVSFIVLIMYVLHRKKNGKFIKRKAVNEEEKIKLIDWEYAAMQDIHLDIAMFCIYSMYNRQQVDNLIDIYFENKCDQQTRIKIYCYISMCGLLWSNWCEYKYTLGVEFGKYSLAQYRFAKDYYNIVIEEMENTYENISYRRCRLYWKPHSSRTSECRL